MLPFSCLSVCACVVVAEALIGLVSMVINVVVLATTSGLLLGTNDTCCNIITISNY